MGDSVIYWSKKGFPVTVGFNKILSWIFFLSFFIMTASKIQTQYVIYSMTPDNRNWSISV